MAGNENGRPWGPIRAMPEARLPKSRRNTRWAQLHREVELRLGQTPESEWLLVPFGNKVDAKRARVALWSQFKGRVRTRVLNPADVAVDIEAGAVLCVKRGPDW